jgi:hypothetical protein
LGLPAARDDGCDLSQSDVFNYLGQPDVTFDQRTFGYRYAQSKGNDWIALVMFDEKGKCTLFGWNAEDSLIDRTASPTTKPK